jgi:hypothetical protein
MSIVTLKKKTASQYNNSSVNQKLFSLNGTYRNQGYIGQTSLSRSLPRTLMRNGGYRNHGGCCGKFVIGGLVTSSVKSTENNKIVKPSVVNNAGMIHTKYKWIWRPQPYTSVKTDGNQMLNTQELYIQNLHKKEIKCVDSTDKIPPANDPLRCSKNNGPLFRPKYTPFNNPGAWSKPGLKTVSQGEYMVKIDKKCGDLDDFKIIKKNRGSPLPSNTISIPAVEPIYDNEYWTHPLF